MSTTSDPIPDPTPQLAPQACLNHSLTDHNTPHCTRCVDSCPAEAIHLSLDDRLPEIDPHRCSGCTGCVPVCPTDALRHAAARPAAMVRDVMQMPTTSRHTLQVACSAVDGGDIAIDCHAGWSPLLLAALAAEGVAAIQLLGIDRCADCPKRFGATRLKIIEAEYQTLNQALGVKLSLIHSQPSDSRTADDTPANNPRNSEPARRAFFRQLLPSLVEGAAKATGEITQAARQAASSSSEQPRPTHSPLPVRLQLFLRALPKLQSNFTPLPATPSLPLGAMQADAHCTACGGCVEACPTRALATRAFGANTILEFQADRCIGCNRCIAICPEEALNALPGISLPAILTGKARPLIMVSTPEGERNASSKGV